MTPDDPRHGEYRGYLQHRRDDEEPCDACALAAFRRNKAMKQRLNAGIRHRVRLGEEAWAALTTIPPKSLATATGMRRGTILKLRSRTAGPNSIVLLATRTAVLTSYRQAATPIGLARRLQAVTAMGWSMSVVAEGTPFTMDAYKRVRRGTSRMFVQHELGECIIAAYEKYGMKPAPDSRSSARTRKWAEAKGWRTALAWDDDTIDDPNARADGGITLAWDPAGYDESRVERRINGDRSIRLHKGESVEVVRRMLADGRTQNEIRRVTGLKPERYLAEIRATQLEQEVAA